jgi:Icc-related predicted phosphoesterase
MKILFASDLHGVESHYLGLFELAERTGARAVMLGGDLLPMMGPFRERAREQEGFIASFLEPTLRNYLSRNPEAEIFLLHGNTDWGGVIPLLKALEGKGLAKFLHDAVHEIGKSGFQVIGYAHVPPTPFYMKDFERPDYHGDSIREQPPNVFLADGAEAIPVDFMARLATLPSIEEELEELPKPRDPARCIYVMHSPPHRTAIDVIHDGRQVGSLAIRNFILARQPLATLHGHIHEAPRMSRGVYAEVLGQTVCINPGRRSRELYAVTFDIEDILGTLEHTVYGKIRLGELP